MKLWKKVTLAAVLVLLAALGLNALFGNPVSKHLARQGAGAYLEEAYPDRDFVLEQVRYDSKTGQYEALVQSPSSVDTHFSLWLNKLGKVQADFYESSVSSGWNTCGRISDGYRALAQPVLDGLNLTYSLVYILGQLEITDQPGGPEYALDAAQFQLDGEYDVRELGRQAGIVSVQAKVPQADRETGLALASAVKQAMEAADLPFYGVEVSLRPESGGEILDLGLIPYADIP